ncbi:hypothetical protein PN450_16995 [Dolichospermum lemmermannii CS-548]|uniref:hypothetical protein n=1 Tax=Dolichospermum lemmermannii TaxID=54295 RepID=UPI00232C6D2F|nr:hypothetical protein [Dolichospermum lemmermannii]MDB9438455.1 hypothetical protein [Dolichospermum lemmermannii CS-548]
MTTEPNDFAYPMYANLPENTVIRSRGLTKRELFALEIFSGLIAVPETNPNALISTSVDLADKLIEQLNKTETITPRPPLESSGY